jgi:hypothetical protein
MSQKVVKITESELRRIISEKLEGDTNEQLLRTLANKAMNTLKTNKSSVKATTKSGINTVISTMRKDVMALLTKTPVIKISPKTVKVLEEPRYNVRVAYDQVHELATEGLESSIRADLMGIDMALQRVKTELMKPAGQTLNIKKMMEDLYYVKDEIGQDLMKRQNLPNAAKELTAPLNRVNLTITEIETLFKTPEKPSSYLVKE